jgi:hypothetical protein
MTGAVAAGELDPESLRLWPSIVAQLGEHFDEYAAAAYWRNKAEERGVLVPDQIVPLTKAWWKVDKTDTIEEWAKLAKRSEGLLQEQDRLIGAWQAQLQRDGRQEGLMVLGKLTGLTARYEGHTNPTVGFEQAFQFAVLVADKAFDKAYPADDADYQTWLTGALKGTRQLEKALKWV